MNKLMTRPSKAKNQPLARLVLLLHCTFLPFYTALAGQDIRLQSGPGQDTILQTGPDVGLTGSHAPEETIRIESDPNTGSVMQVTPQQQTPMQSHGIQTIIVTPEIRINEQ